MGYKASTILLYLTLLIALYFGLGVFYNMKTQNLEGKEALPNIEFWRNFPELVQEGISVSINTAKNFAQWIKSKISGDKAGYNEY